MYSTAVLKLCIRCRMVFSSYLAIGQSPIHAILLGVYDQRILHNGRDTILQYLSHKPNVMGTANLACGLVFTKIFWKNWFRVDYVIIVTSLPHFRKMWLFLRWCHRRFKFCTLVYFLKLNHKTPKSKFLVHKNILWRHFTKNLDQKCSDFEK